MEYSTIVDENGYDFYKLIEIYKNVFDNQDGAVVLNHLRGLVGYDDYNFRHGMVSHELYYREGMRSVVVNILSILKTNTKDVMQRQQGV